MDFQQIILASTAFVGVGTAIGLAARKLLPQRRVTVKWRDNPADIFAHYAGLPSDHPWVQRAREHCDEKIMPEQKGGMAKDSSFYLSTPNGQEFGTTSGRYQSGGIIAQSNMPRSEIPAVLKQGEYRIVGFRNPIRAIIAILRSRGVEIDEISFRQAADRCTVQIEDGYGILKHSTPLDAISELAERANVVIHAGPDGKMRCYDAEDFHRLHPAVVVSKGVEGEPFDLEDYAPGDDAQILRMKEGLEHNSPLGRLPDVGIVETHFGEVTSKVRYPHVAPLDGAVFENAHQGWVHGVVRIYLDDLPLAASHNWREVGREDDMVIVERTKAEFDSNYVRLQKAKDEPLLDAVLPPPPNMGGEGNPQYRGPHYEMPEGAPAWAPYEMRRDPPEGAAVRPAGEDE